MRREHELHGKTLRPGERVFIMLNAANRDPRAYSDPHRLALRRETEEDVRTRRDEIKRQEERLLQKELAVDRKVDEADRRAGERGDRGAVGEGPVPSVHALG